jgi:hypothetical protein
MTDAEVDQIFDLIQTLLSITPKANNNGLKTNQLDVSSTAMPTKKTKLPISLLGFLLVILGLGGLGGGGYAAYLVFTNEGELALEFASIIAATSLFFSLTLIVLARILRIVRSLRR